MLTSKQRAEFRAQANALETTLMVGKDGVTEAVIAEADRLLTARELVKGKVLESALMSAREVSDAICEGTGADGISCVGSKFVIWRFSEKCQEERNQTGRAVVPLPRRFANSAMLTSRRRQWSAPSNAAAKSSSEAKTNNTSCHSEPVVTLAWESPS